MLLKVENQEHWQAVMHATHREMEIMNELRLLGSCRIQDLARRLDVSEETIRRNIRKLSENGLVRKVHGGVYLPDAVQEATFTQRMNVNPDAKRRVATHLANRIDHGDSLILDIGSTTAYVAQALRGHHDLFIVTNSVAVAHTLATRNKNRVFLAGGELRSHDAGAFGKEAVAYVRQFNVKYAVLSAAAIDAANGFMLHDMDEAEFSREILTRAEHSIVAADSSKFGRQAPIRIGSADMINVLVTDAPPPKDIQALLTGHGVEIDVANTAKPAGKQAAD